MSVSVQPAPDVSSASAVADVHLQNVTKAFGDVIAVDDLTLTIRHGEFFSLLGPSGCGKTTTLGMIGGFETPTSGQIFLGDQNVSKVPAYKRDVNTVFQSYALFPHLDVFENIAFGLKRKRLPKSAIAASVSEALRLVDLPGLEKRRSAQLSGGQQQRIALARALVNQPRILLLDEPLGALDLKLRKQMQIELKRIQQDVGITFLYVTHDQEEAMVMSDRLAVMNRGKIEQLGTPEEVYESPSTAFVAGFLGASNLISANVVSRGAAPGLAELALSDGTVVRVPAARVPSATNNLQIGVRPEKLRLEPMTAPLPDGYNAFAGQVILGTFLGLSHQYTVRGAAGTELIAYVQNLGATRPPTLGETVRLAWLPEHTFVV
ncbi:MAG TPA: ABC transporter ATP-binding protein [Solirubrobacteraceae bacterium]|nr:ABC transporter ATP-binding protein [Solirubrobacteraceae bacterium]